MDSSLKISCTLIHTGQHYLILPNSAIAEVLVTSVLNTNEQQPTWGAGQIEWDYQIVPLISFDQLESELQRNNTGKHIILIVRNPVTNGRPAYFGIIASSIPQIVQANSSTLKKNLQPKSLHRYALSYILFNGRPALIPDLPRIAQLLVSNNS